MRVIIRDINEDFIKEVQAQLDIRPNIEGLSCEHTSILDHSVDALVSPANSYGEMGGGIDGLYKKIFCGIEDKLKSAIAKTCGELLVGQATSLVTDNIRYPILIVAPTMRLPAPIKDFHDVYRATRAAFREAEECGCKRISIPGMGTLSGRVPYGVAASMMIWAYEHKDFTNEEYHKFWFNYYWKK